MTESAVTSYYIAPPCSEPLHIVHVDDDLIVVDKPAFLYTVPGRGPENRDAVITRLLPDYPDAVIIHRLDLDTSGLLVVARSLRARQELSQQIRERTMHKIYTAMVWGIVAQDTGIIDLPIAKDPANRPRCKINHAEGKAALTRYTVVSRHAQATPLHTCLRLEPETGRQHQLRLHLATIGHPILGCDLYAHDAALHASPRLMLHACELGFVHPATGNMMAFQSDLLLTVSDIKPD